MSDLDVHRDVVDRGLAAAGLGWDAWPEVAASAALDPGVRLSALLLLLATEPPRVAVEGGFQEFLDPAEDMIDRLRRQKLPWDAGRAGAALRLVVSREDFDDRRVAVALRGTEQVCSAGLADTALLDDLRRLTVWLDGLDTHRWRVPEMRLLARQVLVAATPPGLVDLTLVRDGDAWAGPARAAADAGPADEVAPLVRLLGELGTRKPSKLWRSSVAQALQRPGAEALLRLWLELAADVAVVPPDETAAVGFSGGMLFCHGNDEIVRAAVLATESLVGADWVPEVLGVLARRGAATSGVPGMTASLCLKVASAAVDTLAARRTTADVAVLEQLLEDLTRRDLVRRVGAALGREDEAAQRDDELRRAKAAAVRRKQDPAPRQARAVADGLVSRHLAPVLRARGFSGSGRTLRRFHDDRVDLVTFGSSGDRLSLAYGTRFDAAHPPDEPYPVDRAKARSHHLDVRLLEQWGTTPVEMDGLADRLAELVVPFLDSLCRFELVAALAQHGAGVPDRATLLEGAESPATDGVLGLLALAAGERRAAVELLARRLEHEQSRYYDEPDPASVAFWARQLDRARLTGP